MSRSYLFKGGKPVRRAGLPVGFSLSDGRFATLDEDTVYTDEWDTASAHVRSMHPAG